MPAALRSALRRSNRRALWSAVAAACRVAGIASGSARWPARRGIALRRAGRTHAAVEAFEAARRAPGTTPDHLAALAAALAAEGRWGDAADVYLDARVAADGDTRWLRSEARCRFKAEEWEALARLAREHDTADVGDDWPRWVGTAFARVGDPAAARAIYREAVDAGRATPATLAALADLEHDAGDPAAAGSAYRAGIEQGGPLAPRLRRELAKLLREHGRWDDAAQVLRSNVAGSDDDAVSRSQLAVVLLERHRWAATFVGPLGTVPEFAPDGGLPSDDDERLREAQQLLEEATALEPRVRWAALQGQAAEARAAADVAIEHYQRALDGSAAFAFQVKQPWRFRLEHAYHLAGRPRVEDPLFACEATPSGDPLDPARSHAVPGAFRVSFDYAGLLLEGVTTHPALEQVDLLLDGTRLRSLNVRGDHGLPQFTMRLRRETVAKLPPTATLTVRTPDGRVLPTVAGHPQLDLSIPHGDGSLPQRIAAGSKLDKKGVLSPTEQEVREHQDRYLELYTDVRQAMEERLGRQVFLMYGTLLGCVRAGDFIPGDDDFDAGYVSDQTAPEAVKEEAKGLILDLLEAGFLITFNRRGKLFRIQREHDTANGVHLDLRPVWFADGNVWAHNHASFPCPRDAFLPVATATLRDTEVYVPHRPEVFLEGHYGPGWRVPDPSFSYHGITIDPHVKETLARALLSPAEYEEFAEVVAAKRQRHPGMGRLVSIGSQDLYPLHDLIL